MTEDQLYQITLDQTEKMVEGCADLDVPSDAPKTWITMRSRAQALQIVLLKDLTVAKALSGELDAAVRHVLHALRIRVEEPFLLPNIAADQVCAVAQGVLELCNREMSSADTESQALAASASASQIVDAVSSFKSWAKHLVKRPKFLIDLASFCLNFFYVSSHPVVTSTNDGTSFFSCQTTCDWWKRERREDADRMADFDLTHVQAGDGASGWCSSTEGSAVAGSNWKLHCSEQSR